MAGPHGSHQAGDVVDLPKAVAYGLCEGGFAQQVDDGPPLLPPIEQAVVPVPETADAPANRRRRKS